MNQTPEPTGLACDPCFLPGPTSAGKQGRNLPLHACPSIFSSISILPFIGAYPPALAKTSGKRRDFTVAARQQGKTEAARIRGQQGAVTIDEFFGVAS